MNELLVLRSPSQEQVLAQGSDGGGALHGGDPIRAEGSRLVADFFAGLTIPDLLPQLSEDEQTRLVTLATIGARCRSSVVRDGYSREIELVPGHERPTRLYGQLRQLHAGSVVIGTPGSEVWRLLTKVALDGVHPVRRAVLDFLVARPRAYTTGAIAGQCRDGDSRPAPAPEPDSPRRTLDLVPGYPERWEASERLRERWWAVGGPEPKVEI